MQRKLKTCVVALMQTPSCTSLSRFFRRTHYYSSSSSLSHFLLFHLSDQNLEDRCPVSQSSAFLSSPPSQFSASSYSNRLISKAFSSSPPSHFPSQFSVSSYSNRLISKGWIPSNVIHHRHQCQHWHCLQHSLLNRRGFLSKVLV